MTLHQSEAITFHYLTEEPPIPFTHYVGLIDMKNLQLFHDCIVGKETRTMTFGEAVVHCKRVVARHECSLWFWLDDY